MGLELGNVLGAANSIVAGFGDSQSLKNFLATMDSLGIQIDSRYEVVFSAIPQATFFITNLNTPSMKQNTTDVYFDGKRVEIPQNYEFDHDFSMTVINDASGFIYSALTNFVMGDLGAALVNSGYTMTIKAIGDNEHSGSTITLNGVRIKNVGGLSFKNSGGDIQTFEVACSAIDFSVAPGGLGKVSAIGNAVGNLLG